MPFEAIGDFVGNFCIGVECESGEIHRIGIEDAHCGAIIFVVIGSKYSFGENTESDFSRDCPIIGAFELLGTSFKYKNRLT